jgi:hypothetical protein
MKHIYNIIFLIVLLPLSVVANNEKFNGKHTKEKKIHKEYTVNASAGLKIDNSYGNVNIVTWNQNKTVIDVVIKTNGDNEDKVMEKLKGITVDFTSNGSKVTATTRFGERNARWNDWFGSGKSNVSVEVNYTIKIPITNSVTINNDYGTVNIDRLEGNALIHCDYGQLIIGELLAENNALNFDHSRNSTIQFIKSGTINADYSGFTLQKGEDIKINADHSNSEIGEVNTLTYNNDHGKISIEKVGALQAKGDHISHKIGTISKAININSDYGSITIQRIEATCKNVTLRSSYSGIKIGLAPNYKFDFTLNLDYTSLKDEEILNITNRNESNSSKLLQGYYGAKGSGNVLNINTEYGSVKLIEL